MLAVGLGLEQAGSVTLILNWMTPMLEQAPPWLLVFLVYGISILLSELLSNTAVSAILTPLVIGLSRDHGPAPRPLLFTLLLSASACLATPIGYQTPALPYLNRASFFPAFSKVGLTLNLTFRQH